MSFGPYLPETQTNRFACLPDVSAASGEVGVAGGAPRAADGLALALVCGVAGGGGGRAGPADVPGTTIT